MERFTDLFELSFADRAAFERSEFSFYIVKPKRHAAEVFGFTRELFLVYSPYSALEPRTLQQAEQVISRPRLQGRTEPLYLVLVAPITDIQGQVTDYRHEAEQGRIIVGFSVDELRHDKDPWLLRKRFARTLFSRDLFDMKQPLVNDTYFFGRQALALDLLDRFKRGENTGVFGLRKTGKTSLLFKLRRMIETEAAGIVVYLDAQSPSIHHLRWWELLSHIKDEAAQAAGVKLDHPFDKGFTERTATNRTRQAIIQILQRIKGRDPRVLIIIDESEHISAGFHAASHWEADFSPFWKMLRAIQTEERRVTFLIAGVNSQVSERPSIANQDNPLFSLVGTRYLPMFTAHETQDMVKTLGARMGLLFDRASSQYLAAHYGGHPMLVRLACSWEHQLRSSSDYAERPITVSESDLQETQQDRDGALVHYARHVLEVLRVWYPQEYEILSLLAVGDTDEFEAYARELPESIQHLKAYGLVDAATGHLTIELIQAYLRSEVERAKRSRDRMPSAGEGRVVHHTNSDIENVVTAKPVVARGLASRGESAVVEFKSTLRTNLHTGKADPKIEQSALKTIAAFLNSEGGTLLVGIDDKGAVLGLNADGFADEDKMTLHLVSLIKDRMGAENAPYIRIAFEDLDAKRVLVVSCLPARQPVYVKDGQTELFFVRLLAATVELGVRQAGDYIRQRFTD